MRDRDGGEPDGIVSVDARGTYCPIPVLRLAAALATRAPGARARLLATDPASRSDVEAYCAAGGARLLSADDDGKLLTFEVEKSGSGAAD
ncbi:MAG: sulfurtransferase TusA family protein [Acidobacteriota bacterium]